MESIIARALEYTLKYWLKSFSRDQFKLQGRTAQLSNLGEVPFAPLSLSNLDADFDVFCFCFVIRVLSFFFFWFWVSFGGGRRYQWRRAAREPGVASRTRRRHSACREAPDHGKIRCRHPPARNSLYFNCFAVFLSGFWAYGPHWWQILAHAAVKLPMFDMFR
jgi:hypothetical protein